MSLSHYRDSICKELQALAESKTNDALNLRASFGVPADQYAMVQVDRLAMARAFLEATKVVVEAYKRLTEAPAMPAEPSPMVKQKKEESVYG